MLSDSVISVLIQDREILGVMAEGARARCVTPMKPERAVVNALSPETDLRAALWSCDLGHVRSSRRLGFPTCTVVGLASRYSTGCSELCEQQENRFPPTLSMD